LVEPASASRPPAFLPPAARAAVFPIVVRTPVEPASASHRMASFRDVARSRRAAALAAMK
jgi:hypothetical protein